MDFFEAVIRALSTGQMWLLKFLQCALSRWGLACLGIVFGLALALTPLTATVLGHFVAKHVVFVFLAFFFGMAGSSTVGATGMMWDDDAEIENKYVRRGIAIWFFGFFWFLFVVGFFVVLFALARLWFRLLTGDFHTITTWGESGVWTW
jgi:hypothetical protein